MQLVLELSYIHYLRARKKGEYNEEEEDRGDRIEDSGEKLEAINHRNLKVIHWNVNGISKNNNKKKKEERIKMWKADIILIQETKLRPKQRTPQFKSLLGRTANT